jgi:DNA primase small subunit
MPHSLSPEDSSFAPAADDTPAAHPEAQNDETQTTENTPAPVTVTSNADSQISDAVDQDMTMADAGVEGEEVEPGVEVEAETKPEVKLEDLFADMESDEEFPSSNARDVKLSSSPPEAPSSPVSVHRRICVTFTNSI